MTDKQVLKLAERIEKHHRKAKELAELIEVSDHPLAKQIFNDLHDNGIFSFANAVHVVRGAINFAAQTEKDGEK